MKTRKKKVVYSGNQVDLPYMEFIQNNLFNMSHPVESIFETTNSSCNTPENLVNYFKTLFGVSTAGTWERFGEGKVVVGYQSSDNDFKTVGGTGGSKYLQAHTHTMTPSGTVSSSFTGTQGTTSEKGSHDHSFTPSGSVSVSSNPAFTGNSGTLYVGPHNHKFHFHGVNSGRSEGIGNAYPPDADNSYLAFGSDSDAATWWTTTASTTDYSYIHAGNYLKDNKAGIYIEATSATVFGAPGGSISGGSYSFSGSSGTTGSKGDHTHTITPSGSVSSSFSGSQGTTSSSGSGSTQNLQPYIVVYRYRRIS